MNHLASDQRAARLDHFSLAMIFPRLLIGGHMALVGSFGLVIVGTLAVMHFTNAAPNPFSVYADIYPGQLVQGLEVHGFSCSTIAYSYYQDPLEVHCELHPITGSFSAVSVIHIRGIIHETTFTLRNSTMTMADLATLLDVSEIRSRGVVLFTWRGYIGAAQIDNPDKHFSLWRHVWQVMLTNTRLGLPQR